MKAGFGLITAPVAALAVIALAPAVAFAACDGAPLPTSRPTVTVDGAPRAFIVRTASTYNGRTPAPVVFAFHPFGMNGDYMAVRAPITREWREAIAIYPTGAPRPGSGATPQWQSAAGDLADRDLHFFDAMLEWVREHACVDSRRVYALGYSNGAGFAYLLACERANVVAGLAIASGRLGCEPSRPLPVIINHGTQDSTIPLDAAARAAVAWSTVDRCAAPPKAVANGCVTATGCSAPVALCTYAGGHEYDSSFTATAVQFFKR